MSFCGEVKLKQKCSVPGCKDLYSSRFRFPRDPNYLAKWLRNIGDPALERLTVEKLYKKYVCVQHFVPEFLLHPKNRRGLTYNAVPTLNLPKDPIESPNNLQFNLTSHLYPSTATQSEHLTNNVTTEIDLVGTYVSTEELIIKIEADESGEEEEAELLNDINDESDMHERLELLTLENERLREIIKEQEDKQESMLDNVTKEEFKALCWRFCEAELAAFVNKKVDETRPGDF